MTFPRVLILCGVAAWIPYAVWKYLLGGDPPRAPFLAVHLCGVVPGAFLKIMEKRGKRNSEIGKGRG
jgi:hypothetical protein